MDGLSRRMFVGLGVCALTLAAAAGCGSSGSSSSGGGSSAPAASVPAPDAAAFTSDFSLMKTLVPLAAAGKGMVGVLLPDTTTSARYVEFDAPYLKQAFEAAGLKPSQFKIDNAQGSASTMQQQAEADITAGASVLLVDPLDPGSGAAIESNAESQGVKVIDYDRLVTGGPADRYYVSFNNVQVGQLIGKGEVSCIAAWNVKKPNILIMDGDPTDNNAKLFAQGYNGVLAPKFADKSYTKVGEPAGTWDPPTAADDVRAAVHRALRTSTRSSRPTTTTQTPSSRCCRRTRSRPRRSRPPVRTRRRRGCRTSSRATSAARCTSRSTSRPRQPPRWRCTCAPARRRRPPW